MTPSFGFERYLTSGQLPPLTTVKRGLGVSSANLLRPGLFPRGAGDTPSHDYDQGHWVRGVGQYFSVPLKFEDLLALSPALVDPLELVSRQQQLRYPSQETEWVEWNRWAMPWARDDPAELRQKIAAQLETRDLHPDLSKPYPNGPIDYGVNQLLALELARPDAGFDSPAELEAKAGEADLVLNRLGLYKGFVLLVREDSVDMIRRIQQPGRDTLDIIFGRAADWMTMMTLDRVRAGEKLTTMYPYGEDTPKSYKETPPPPPPDIGFLPHLMTAQYLYLGSLPGVIPPGMSIAAREMLGGVRSLFAFTQSALERSQAGADSLATPGQIVQFGNQIGASFRELLHSYQRNPDLLYRETAYPSLGTGVNTFSDRRQAIIDAGGRAPRNLIFDFVPDARRANI